MGREEDYSPFHVPVQIHDCMRKLKPTSWTDISEKLKSLTWYNYFFKFIICYILSNELNILQLFLATCTYFGWRHIPGDYYDHYYQFELQFDSLFFLGIWNFYIYIYIYITFANKVQNKLLGIIGTLKDVWTKPSCSFIKRV